MPYIGKTPLTGAYQLCDTITTSATATYNLLVGGSAVIPGSANNCIVSLNGVVQAPVGAFTVSGSTITFASTLSATDVIDFILILGNVFDIGTPTNGAVGTSQLATNLTVTHALGAVGTPSITFTGDTNTGIFSPTADTIAFTEGGTEAMRIDGSGNVGIGQSSPVYRLQVNSSANSSTTDALVVQNAGVSDLGSTTGIRFKYGGAEPAAIRAILTNQGSGAGSLGFFTSSDGTGASLTERMRIDSSGNVGIGETSVSSKLHIKSDGSVNACARMNNTEAGTGSSNTVIFQRNGTNIGFITATGTATGYVTSSDYRLKENVVYNLNGIERIKLLKPARFNFIVEPNKIVDGFIAHEVSDIVPEAIHGTKDQIDSEGKPVHQGIDQSKLVPLLTGALQEAIAKIEQLESRLITLENK